MSVYDAFLHDQVISPLGYMPPVVQWRDARYETPKGNVLAVRTPYGIFLHSMLDRDGKLMDWQAQPEKWTDGRFEYADVTHWVRLS